MERAGIWHSLPLGVVTRRGSGIDYDKAHKTFEGHMFRAFHPAIALVLLATAASAALEPVWGEAGDTDADRSAWIPRLSSTYARLATVPSVRRELKLTADQEATIDVTAERMKAVIKRRPTLRESLAQPDGKKKMDEYVKQRRAVFEEMKEALDATLEPEQMSRLRGMALQIVGPGAICDKEIQRDLALSDDQLARIEAINVDMANSLRQMRGRSSRSATPKSQVSVKDYGERLTNVLTEDQRAAFAEMQGAKFAIPSQEMREMYRVLY
jgi:hypothetical protein